jgi:ATP phosphoribosyltransferase regulatory subunit
VRVQLDPTFQPHFDLYNGLVFKLVCQGKDAPVAIASGGRYDQLMARFCDDPSLASGTGFGFSIGALQELLASESAPEPNVGPWLVATPDPQLLPAALARMAALHAQGDAAELCSQVCADEAEAQCRATERGCRGVIWLA